MSGGGCSCDGQTNYQGAVQYGSTVRFRKRGDKRFFFTLGCHKECKTLDSLVTMSESFFDTVVVNSNDFSDFILTKSERSVRRGGHEGRKSLETQWS